MKPLLLTTLALALLAGRPLSASLQTEPIDSAPSSLAASSTSGSLGSAGVDSGEAAQSTSGDPVAPALTWSGGDGPWGSDGWLLSPETTGMLGTAGTSGPVPGAPMIVGAGHVRVAEDYAELPAGSLLVEGGVVEVTADGILKVAGGATVATGILLVDGLLEANDVVISAGGSLQGSGTITAPTVTIGGWLSPGGSIPMSAALPTGSSHLPEPGSWAIWLALCAAAGIAVRLRRKGSGDVGTDPA